MVKAHTYNGQTTTLTMTAAATLLACLVSAAAAEVVTNQFHVHVKREALEDGGSRSARQVADEIARDNGFHNLGHVSNKQIPFDIC